MPKYETKPLPFKADGLQGISDKTALTHDKLYQAYVKKKDQIQEELLTVDLPSANQTYSQLRALKDAETFAVNGAYLHEIYFSGLGGNGQPTGDLINQIAKDFGSLEIFLATFKACSMAARGWAVLAWDTFEEQLRIYNGDAHNQGGVWGALPIMTVDVYEHAYFIDYGSDRPAYLEALFKNLDWETINKRWGKVKEISLR